MQYKRKAALGGFKVVGMFKITNPHAANLNIDQVTYSITSPTGQATTGDAECSGTEGDYYSQQSTRAANSMTPQLSGKVATTAPGGRKPSRFKLAAVKKAATAHGAKGAIAYDDEDGSSSDEVEYEEGGSGPLFCSFEATVPDDSPSTVTVTVVTDQQAKVTTSLGVLDWSKADTSKGNMWVVMHSDLGG